MEDKNEKIIRVNLEEQMKSAYIDYSMSVIVARALPDVRDGLKPVHRRVLFGMSELGIRSNTSFKKSARIVGEVLGKYHPHGDSSVYDAMVRMAQPWLLRYPMVDGQGNFGSIDGDSAAAMRYTEARLTKFSEEMLADIDKDTVDFQNNFDDSLQEPVVLPSRLPYLLVNGASGIAVGMATNMAPHNLGEVIDGINAYIDNNDITIEELMKYIKAPDFPTGGIIYGYDGVRDAFMTGRGRIVVRGETTIEEDDSGRESIIVTSVPYQINKADMVKKIADMVNEKKIEGISDIRDESDRRGTRIVFELKREAMSTVVLNKLFLETPLQSSFNVNNIALVHGRPMLLNLKQLIQYYVEHRHDVLIRKTKYELVEAERRAHILEGLLIAVDNIDEIVHIIKNSANVDVAKVELMSRFGLDDIQAKAILDMRLARLTGLERDKLKAEYEALLEKIKYLKEVLDSFDLRMKILKDEFTELKNNYADERRTKIVYTSSDFAIEDLIHNEKVVVTITHLGYIKRTPLAEYRQQRRGGKGSKGSGSREEDFVEKVFVARNHNYILFFTTQGKCFRLRVFEVPEGTKASKGRAIQNLLSLPDGDSLKTFIIVESLTDNDYLNEHSIVLCSKKGVVKKTSLSEYSLKTESNRSRQNGIIALVIREGDELMYAALTSKDRELLIASKKGRAIRFNESTVRSMGRTASGVKGIELNGDDDEVVGFISSQDPANTQVLVVSENGFGKRSLLDDYRNTNRGGKGVKIMNVTDKTGNVIAIIDVMDKDELIIITRNGILIRLSVEDMRVMGRVTQGVKLIDLRDNDEIAAVTRVKYDPDDEDEDYDDDRALDESDVPQNENPDDSDDNGTKVEADVNGKDNE
ncbi:MAG: DNA gyrase subunit A [Bacteroidales bacterium]|nr:DNA gyrase subunit A [Bacteroidales bacterium]